MVAADVASLLVETHEPVGIAVVDNRAVSAAFQDEIMNVGQICLQRLGRPCKDSARGAVYARGINAGVRKEPRGYHRARTAAAVNDHAELFAYLKRVQNLLLMRRYDIFGGNRPLTVPRGAAVIFTVGGCPLNRRDSLLRYCLLSLSERGSVGI